VLAAGEPLLVWALIDVALDEGSPRTYQVFVGGRRAGAAAEFLHGKDRELIATVPTDEGDVVLYDALIDPDLAISVLHLTAPDLEVEVRRPIVLEHSNSSVVYDESTILKIFRKVEPGPNPDVEITRTLSAAGFDGVLAPLAELRRDGTDLAVLRRFLVGATDGWQLARTSVRDLLASRLAPEESGGDLAPTMERLGTTIARLHLALGDSWGRSAGDADRWTDRMEADLDGLLASHGAALRRVGFDEATVRAQIASVRLLTDAGAEIHIHGDLHLAQVMTVDRDWYVLDFEGEPARVPEGRFTVSSPLRDVAGMLRSFHYAVVSGLAEWDEGDEELLGLVADWEQRNRLAFLDGYLGTDGVDVLLPSAPTARLGLLTAFELDKAVYELAYELDHRPDKVGIPLEGIVRLLRPVLS